MGHWGDLGHRETGSGETDGQVLTHTHTHKKAIKV